MRRTTPGRGLAGEYPEGYTPDPTAAPSPRCVPYPRVMSTKAKRESLIVIGFGAMASAVVEGAIRASVLDPEWVFASDPNPGARAHAQRLGCEAFANAAEAMHAAPPDARVLLSVKPQMLSDVARDIESRAADRAVVSILAGATSASIAGSLGTTRVVRVMPNTPARIGMGISAVAPGEGATGADLDFARRLFGAVGVTVDLNESLMDAFTALAGSGPAYLFYLAEGMTDAGEAMGFEPGVADRIVRAVLSGATGLLSADASHSARQLREAVTSRGGTTAAALATLDAAGAKSTIAAAVRAAESRAAELGANPA